MYQLFTSAYRGDGKFSPMIDANRNRAIIKREMNRVIAYYRKRESVNSSASTHVIVQLIKKLNLSIRRSETSTVDAVEERAGDVCQQLGLIHPYNPEPREFVGQFYNRKVREIIIGDDFNESGITTLPKKWLDVAPVKVLTHPFNDINLGLTNGNYPISQSGFAAICVDITILMLQYRKWALSRLNKDVNDIRPEVFVYTIVIPNMLHTHMDICYINRCIDIYRGRLVPVMKRIHPISVIDITMNVDRVIDEQLKVLNRKDIDPNNFFTSFEAVMGGTWKSVLTPPKVIPNSNMKWALILACVRYIHFMVEYIKDTPKEITGSQIYRIERSFRVDINNGHHKEIVHPMIDQMVRDINIWLK